MGNNKYNFRNVNVFTNSQSLSIIMKNLDDYQSISITNNKFEQDLSVFFYYHKILKYIFSLYLLPASIRMKIVNFIISLYSILNNGRIFYNRAVTQNNTS